MKYLLSISIGPVQDFIATARRSRDLWFGSWLLSELSKAAAFSICEGKGENLSRLIFPAVTSVEDLTPNSDYNVANKILAQVENPEAIGRLVEQAIQTRLSQIRQQAFEGLTKTDGYFMENIAQKQVDDMVEVFWSAYPLDDDSRYADVRTKVETLLKARKATRNFASCSEWSSSAPKSALDGQRESVIREEAFDKLTAGQLRRRFNVRGGERLCGVGLLKRNGNRGTDDSFFSTSHVAALPLIERVGLEQQPELETYIRELTSALNLAKESSDLGRVPFRAPYRANDFFSRTINQQRIGYDGHILFAERLNDLIEDKSEKQKTRTNLEKARNALKAFLRRAFDGQSPLTYYALLLGDGDNMGKAIDQASDVEQHRSLSKALSTFAKNIKPIVVEKHKGSLVYAGGDDVLAFLPLHTVLQCARELANLFKQSLQEFAFQENGRKYQPTLSVGIVIAHHLEPLQDALTLVRSAERTAKTEVIGKEALALILSKRSGVNTMVKGTWKRDDVRQPVDQRLLNFAQLHRAGDIPDGAGYELRDLHLRLNCDRREPAFVELHEAMRKEAVRILARKDIKNDKILDQLVKDIDNESTSIEDLANELIVARILAEAFDQSAVTEQLA
jgi:CRISPR-associated protein Cmr2